MQTQKLEAELGLHTVDAGFGRTDALSRIGNMVFGKLGSMNLTETDAPVNFPSIWDTPWFYWVQYNGSIRLPMVRNIGEALGVGAAVNADFESTVDIKNLHLMEEQVAGQQPFAGLQAPAWPEKVLGEIDGFKQGTGLWETGKGLYEKHCIHCHYRIEDYQFALSLNTNHEEYRKHWSQPNRFGRRYMKLPLINFVDIGTDPAAVIDFYKRIVYTGSLDADQSTMSALKALTIATDKVREREYCNLGLTPAEYAAYDGYRELTPEPAAIARLDYKARPLNGIWATAPYLHNGSVANLYQMLLPADQRMKSFYVGSVEFDPKHVGFSTKWAPGLFRMDTTVPGNRNTGHEFRNLTKQERDSLTPFQRERLDEQKGWAVFGVVGPELDDEDRWALIEYLKSLGSPQPARERPPAGEAEAVKKLAQIQSLIQRHEVGPDKRGQHAKTHGTVSASFQVADNLPDRHRVGLFRQAKDYKAVIRFSNGDSKNDGQPDVHGMAIKVSIPNESDPEKTVIQDFVLADNPVFFAKNVQHLLEFTDMRLAKATESQLIAKFPQLLTYRKFMTSPLESKYWSQTPYKFGELAAVKYCVVPNPDKAKPDEQDPKIEKSADFLCDVLKKRLTEPNPPVSFDFCIQEQANVNCMPIEDPTREWKSKLIKLATITIEPQVLDAAQQAQLAKSLSFNPWNALPEHRPLGSINRARRTIYEESRKLRYETNNVKENSLPKSE